MRRLILGCLIPILLMLLYKHWAGAREFVPPDVSTRTRAIGPIEKLSPQLQRVYTPTPAFAPIPDPGPADWLRSQPESGQTVAQYLRSGNTKDAFESGCTWEP